MGFSVVSDGPWLHRQQLQMREREMERHRDTVGERGNFIAARRFQAVQEKRGGAVN